MGGGTHPRNGYTIYQIIQHRVALFRACPRREGREPQLRERVCDGRGVDRGGQERGVRSGGSFICRSRRGGLRAGAAQQDTQPWSAIGDEQWAGEGDGDGVGTIAAMVEIERRL